MGLGIDPTNDYVFRLAFGDPANSDLLIHLLNAILQLPSPIMEVEILNPFIDKEFETDKLSILDIRARDSGGRLLNVEMQTSVTLALRERLVYYAACLYTSQLSEGDAYSSLRPTIGICILSKSMFPGIPAGHLKFVLSDLRHGIELTQHFQIHTVELPKYNPGAYDSPTGGILEKWAWLFSRAEELDASDLRVRLPEPPFQKVIGILEMISNTPAQRHIYESLQKAARDKIWKMEAAHQEGLLAGREEGLLAGRADGLLAGRADGLLAGRAEGREEGREEGKQLGIAKGQRIGQILMLEQFLNEQQSAEHDLAGLSLAELDERVANLQARMPSRRNP